MKKILAVYIICLSCLVGVNNADAVVTKDNGQGSLFLSEDIIDQFIKYINTPIKDNPLNFFITQDQQNVFIIIEKNSNYKGYSGSGPITRNKKKCENKFKQACFLFSNQRYVVWNNGVNPFKKDVSLFNRGIDKQEIIKRLEALDFIGNSTTDKKIEVDRSKTVKKTDVDKRKEEERLAEEKRKEEERLAEEKRKEEERLAEEKRKEEERLAEEKRKEEEISRKLSIFRESDLEKNKKIIQYTKEFVKLYPEEFDIVKIAKLFLSVDPILKDTMSSLELKNLEILRKFTSESEKFKTYEKQFLRQEKEMKIELVDSNLDKLKKDIAILKNYLASNITSFYSREIIRLIEKSEENLKEYNSLEDLKVSSKMIDDLMTKVFELEKNILNLNSNRDDLKNYLVKYMSTDISPKIIQQIEIIENSLKNITPENVKKINEGAKKFIEKEIIEYEKKVADEKRKEEERLAEEKRVAEEKKRQEYLKTPEGQKEEKERIRKEKERLAEEKRLKNFKPISMTCTYSGQGGVKVYKWVFDGKNINWEGMDLKVGDEIDDGMGTKISTKKLDGRDNFQIDMVIGFLPMTISTNFDQRSSVMETLGTKIYGTCI